MVCDLRGLCWCLTVRAVLTAEIEVTDKHGNRVAQIVQLLAVSNRAAGKTARERPHRQVCAFGVASCGFGQIRASNARLTLYSDDHKWIVIARNHLIRAAKHFGFRSVVNFVAEYLFHGGIASAIPRERIGCKLKPLRHTPL